MSWPSSVLVSERWLGPFGFSFGHFWPRAGKSAQTNKSDATATNPAADFMVEIICPALRLPAIGCERPLHFCARSHVPPSCILKQDNYALYNTVFAFGDGGGAVSCAG